MISAWAVVIGLVLGFAIGFIVKSGLSDPSADRTPQPKLRTVKFNHHGVLTTGVIVESFLRTYAIKLDRYGYIVLVAKEVIDEAA